MSTLFSLLRARLRQRVWRWLDQRSPAAPQQTLRQRALFVFPTPFGFAMLALVILLYILGTNYQNNLVILLGYLLLVLCIGAILLAFLNLHHTTVTAKPCGDASAGDDVCITLHLQRTSGIPQALQLSWQDQPFTPATGPTLLLTLAASHRGYYQIPRLKLQSVYPFGLVRCWSYVRLDCWYWVFPAPRLSPFSALQAKDDSGQREEWSGQRQYQPGDAWRQLDWKRFSRQQQLLVHQYSAMSQPAREIWLSPDPRLESLEAQLSDLAARAQLFSQRAQPFGLRLAHREVAIGLGPAHLRQVLQELALC
jgi:uncharacterized protein (DUF58 family)